MVRCRDGQVQVHSAVMAAQSKVSKPGKNPAKLFWEMQQTVLSIETRIHPCSDTVATCWKTLGCKLINPLFWTLIHSLIFSSSAPQFLKGVLGDTWGRGHSLEIYLPSVRLLHLKVGFRLFSIDQIIWKAFYGLFGSWVKMWKMQMKRSRSMTYKCIMKVEFEQVTTEL